MKSVRNDDHIDYKLWIICASVRLGPSWPKKTSAAQPLQPLGEDEEAARSIWRCVKMWRTLVGIRDKSLVY